MNISLEDQNGGAVKLSLQPKESFHIRQQGLLAMSSRGQISIENANDGICTLNNGDQSNEFWLAGQLTGKALAIQVQHQTIFAQRDVFLGAHPDLTLAPTSSLPVSSTQAWLAVDGAGALLLSAVGSIYSLQVDSEYIVNSAYIVAYSASLKYEETPAENTMDEADPTATNYTFLGKGFIWCQTHRPQMLGALLAPQLKKLKA